MFHKTLNKNTRPVTKVKKDLKRNCRSSTINVRKDNFPKIFKD